MRQSHAVAHTAASDPSRLAPRPAPPLATVPGSTPDSWPSKEHGAGWTPDMAQAQHDAQIALNSIDWSKRDLVLWVPGTDNHIVHPAFEAAVHEAYSDGSASLTRIDYPATWDMRPSTATGIATLKLVLAGIAAHGGDHRVLLAGESQGAWVIGEAMADPMLRRVVDRAVLMGHPFLAAHHYDDGHDPAIVEINNPGDQVAAPIVGNLENALDAMIAIHKLHLWKIPSIAQALIENPLHAKLTALWLFRSSIGKAFMKDPHNYSTHMTAAVEFLKNGVFNDGTDPASDASVVAAEARRLQALSALSASRGTSLAPA